jgi:hypothetical protein
VPGVAVRYLAKRRLRPTWQLVTKRWQSYAKLIDALFWLCHATRSNA